MAILQETGPNHWGCFPQEKEVNETWAGVLEDYKKQNQTPKLLLRSFPIEMPYKLIWRTEISDLLTLPRSLEDGAERWKRFFSRHPDSGGYIELSAVGFNADKSKAFVYIAHHCGMLCGAGGYVFLEKRDGKWVEATVKASNCAWIS